ncbi:hypothetical protein FRB94_007549 [Tulasnella sp. JGI-2019a]|nr:hypothetical protein FRB94_007549 [Tulasnella sp. JGI-2019a]
MKRRNNTIAKDDAGDQVETLPGPAKRVKRKAVPRTPEPTAKEGAAVIADEPVFEEVTNEAFVQQYAINLAGADVYYQPNTVDSETANRWYEELNKLDTCASAKQDRLVPRINIALGLTSGARRRVSS